MKYYVNKLGEYIVDIDDAIIDDSLIEVIERPGDNYKWENGDWKYVGVEDKDRVLSRPQFSFLLAITGFDEVWNYLQDIMKADGNLHEYAILKAERERTQFRLDRTLSIVENYRDKVPSVDLSESTIRAAWDQAELL